MTNGPKRRTRLAERVAPASAARFSHSADLEDLMRWREIRADLAADRAHARESVAILMALAADPGLARAVLGEVLEGRPVSRAQYHTKQGTALEQVAAWEAGGPVHDLGELGMYAAMQRAGADREAAV
jgi:hypothetical protein